jgi:hypothetical protein
MHSRHLLKTNNISKFAVIVLSILLLTGISLVPALQIGVHGQVQQQQQQQQPQQLQQQNQVSLSQVIKQMQVIKQVAQQVASANPDTNATHVQQILVQLAKQTAQTASQEQAIQEIRQISSQIAKYPFGPLSQVLSHFAQQVASGNSNVVQIVQQTVQEKASSGGTKNITQSLSNTAVQQASGGLNNVNQVIRQAAQILANRAGVSVEKVESVIIQIALQISQAQGKSITGQYIFQFANQIAQNPNGVLAQAILKLVNQDDGGKSTQTTTVIKNVVKSSDGSSSGSNGVRKVNKFNCIAEGVNICSEIKGDLNQIFPGIPDNVLKEKFPVIEGKLPADSKVNQLGSDTINVFINADPESEEFVPIAIKVIKFWSDGMKQFTNRPDLWNFNIVTSKQVAGDFEKLPNRPNDIMIKLVGDPEETKAVYEGYRIEGKEQRDDVFGSSIVHVYTSTKEGAKDSQLLYNTFLHELGHSLKLRHPTVNGKCVSVMCDGAIADEASFKAEPGPLEFSALAHKYMYDGWKGVNRLIDSDDGYYDFGNGAIKPVSSGGYNDDDCEWYSTTIKCSEAVEPRNGYTSDPNIADEPPEWCKNLGDACANYVVCEDNTGCRYDDEEGYIVAEEEPADELLGKGLRLAQYSPQIIPESPVDGVGEVAELESETPIDEPIIDDSSPADIVGGTAFDIDDESVIDNDNEVDGGELESDRVAAAPLDEGTAAAADLPSLDLPIEDDGEFSDEDTGDEDASDDEDDTGEDNTSVAEFSEGGADETSDGGTDDGNDGDGGDGGNGDGDDGDGDDGDGGGDEDEG